jgi:hypothetical protein
LHKYLLVKIILILPIPGVHAANLENPGPVLVDQRQKPLVPILKFGVQYNLFFNGLVAAASANITSGIRKEDIDNVQFILNMSGL